MSNLWCGVYGDVIAGSECIAQILHHSHALSQCTTVQCTTVHVFSYHWLEVRSVSHRSIKWTNCILAIAWSDDNCLHLLILLLLLWLCTMMMMMMIIIIIIIIIIVTTSQCLCFSKSFYFDGFAAVWRVHVLVNEVWCVAVEFARSAVIVCKNSRSSENRLEKMR